MKLLYFNIQENELFSEAAVMTAQPCVVKGTFDNLIAFFEFFLSV